MIKRVEPRDAKKVAEFLQKTFTEDAASGGNPDLQTEDSLGARCETHDVWVCIEHGKALGVLQGQRGGIIELWGKPYTFNHFILLAVDHHLYKTSRSEAIRIAGALSKFAVDDLRDNGGMGDFIVVEGPVDSRGASWCRLLRMSETPRGSQTRFILPFNLIWDRVKATEAL